jgi:hypothetical protein
MNSSSTTGTVIQLAAGAIGSCWGYPGMMIGLSIGAFIASKVAGSHKSNNNEDIKNTNFMTRLDNVPYVIGTAMCPGQLVWFGQMSLLDSATLRAGTSGSDYFSSYYRPLNSKFAVAFASKGGSAYASSYPYDPRINRVFFDGKDKWNWCLWLADVVRWKASLKAYDLGTPAFNIDINCNTQVSGRDYLLTGVPHRHFCWMSYDGWFGDYSSFELMSPNEITKALDGEDPYNAGIDFDFGKVTTLQRFPNITAEISSGSLYTHEGFSNERLSYNNNSVTNVPDDRHSCRDGMHDYYYYFSRYNQTYIGDLPSNKGYFSLRRIHPVYGDAEVFPYINSYIADAYVAYYGGINPCSRTDEWLDRIYFFIHRWFENRYTPYAKYSLAYDLFYIDRKTLLPHSLKLDEKIYVSDAEGPASTIHILSMEVTEDYLLAFGWMVQDSFPLNYSATIINIEIIPGGRRVYLDLSGVPNGTFDGWFCWSTSMEITEWWGYYATASWPGNPVEIINQTTTYIDTDGDFGIPDRYLIGQGIYINYAQTWEQQSVVADLGSTTTKIICQCPGADLRSDGSNHFYSVKFVWQNYNTEYRIDWDRTEHSSNIFLLDPLPMTPAPGTVFLLRHSSNTPLKRDVVHRVLPDRMQDRYEECKQMPWYWDDNWYQDQPPTTDGWRPAHVQNGDANLLVVLKFDKNTGEFLGLLNEASTYVRHIHAWSNALQYTTSNESTIITCATDKQIFVHSCCMQNASNGSFCDFVINSETLSVSDRSWGAEHVSNPGIFPVATAWLNTYDPTTHEIVKTWYSLWWSHALKREVHWEFVNWTYVEVVTWVNDYSIFFSRLVNGSFNNVQKIFIRKVVYNGLLYAGWWLGHSRKETRFIAKMGLENKLFIYLNHAWDGGNYSFGGYKENWVYEAPTEDAPQGNVRCIDQSGQDWISVYNASWALGFSGFNDFTSTLSTVIAGANAYQGGIYADSYHCDCNPITSIYNLLYYSEAAFGGWFNYTYDHPYSFNPYGQEIVDLFYNINYTLYYYEGNTLRSTQSYYPHTYNAAQTHCQQAVTAQVIINDQLVSYLEPRYQYSECISNAKPFYQIVKDVMQSCMGWITLCQGMIRFVVPKQGEMAEYYFGTEETGRIFTATQDSPAWNYYSGYGPDVPENVYGTDRNTSGIIYINVSNYPFNYFKGETGSFTFDDIHYEFVVVGNCWANKIRISIYNPSTLPSSWGYQSIPFTGTQFTIYRKDNIKEGSFVYGQKSKMGIPNITRLEFEDRTKNYITDISEVVSESLRQNDGYDKIQTYSMPGIKRATQAARVVQQLQDYLEFVEWTCGFETDIMGMHLCPGVIIGVSHPVTGWVNKLFRVMSLEETGDDFNMKLELEEYVPSVYHDQGIPPIISGTGSGTGTSGWNSTPLPLDNFSMLEDQTMPYLWIGYNSAGVQSNLIGVNVLRLNGSTWELVGTFLGVPVTMELSVALTDSKFDNQSISYTNSQGGSIPLSGTVWIGDELIGYNGVDTTNQKLMNLVRGVNDTPITSHSVGGLITVFGTATYIEFVEGWIGLQQFKVTPLVYGVASLGEETSAPVVSQVIVGYAFKPYPPESLRLVEE